MLQYKLLTKKKRLALAIFSKVMLQYKLLTKKRLALAIFSKVMLQYKLLTKKKTSIRYFQQGNATVQAADKRLHGYYIQDIFKQ